MMKRFVSLLAVLAFSLLAACAQVPSDTGKMCDPNKPCCQKKMKCCKEKGNCPEKMAAMDGAKSDGKMCDETKRKWKKKKHHKKHHRAAAPVAPVAPVVTATEAPAPEPAKGGMIEGVKKMIKDVKKPE